MVQGGGVSNPVREPSLPTIKRLFAESGCRCAFPDCEALIVLATGEIIGEICHIKARNTRGPRYDRFQSDADRQSYDNLLLLCPTHHKTIDAQPESYTVDVLYEMKFQASTKYGRPERMSDEIFGRALLAKLNKFTIVKNSGNIALNSPGAIQAGTLVFKSSRNINKINSPPETIGSDGDATRYVKHLIDRYNEYARSEPSRTRKFQFAVIYKVIEREFGSNWKLINLNRFEDVCTFLQTRIGRTRIGKLNAAKGYPLFSNFEEFTVKYRK